MAATLLFDLGGVVVDYRGPERLVALTGGAMSLADAHAALSSPALHAFERGEIAPLDFAAAMVRDCALSLSAEDFIADFETWPETLLPGAPELIDSLRGRWRLACLSNINIPHWRRCHALGLPRLFDAHFLSHELGARKPEAAAFARTLEELRVDARDVVFFDDVAANVVAARGLGLSAFEVSSAAGLRGALCDAGII